LLFDISSPSVSLSVRTGYHSHCNNTILREVFRSGIKRQSGPGTVTDKVYDGKGRTTLGIKVDDEYGAVFSQALDNLYKLDEGVSRHRLALRRL
jgi:hypothetical protein